MNDRRRRKRGQPDPTVAGTEPWVDPECLRREKTKARELRRTQWWKRKVASGICRYCGRRFSPDELTMDHVVPLVKGGRSTKGNCVPACKECNVKKKSLLPVEWEEYLESLQQ
jgi:5-methylcytosine-specific restriction protein A